MEELPIRVLRNVIHFIHKWVSELLVTMVDKNILIYVDFLFIDIRLFKCMYL